MDNSCRVLIVDDEILVRQGIKHHLNWEQEGFRIVGEASNGKEALELIEQLNPHIVITDIVMPIMDGEELARIVKAHYPEIEVIILSSFGQFDYVRSTFQSGVADYILKPQLESEELLRILRQTVRKIPSLQLEEASGEYNQPIEQTIDKLVSGFDAEYDSAAVQAELPYSGFCLLGADLKLIARKDSSQVARMKAKIAGELDYGLDNKAYVPVVPEDSNRIVFLVNADKYEVGRKLSEIGRKLAGWSAEHAPGIGWTVGKVFSDFNQVGAVYRDNLMKLNEYRFYFPNQNLIIHSELPVPTGGDVKFDMPKFTEDMNKNQFGAAFQSIRDYIAAVSGNYKADVFGFKSFLGNIIFNMTVTLGQKGYDVKDLDEAKYGYFKSIDESQHVGEATGLLDSFIAEASERIESKLQSGNPNMMMLLDYVRDHYAEPISLTEVAKHFHFNPSYLSSYFTANNKEGFSEYLNKIRVEKAAELLRQDAASISEISSMVGYSDHSYFTKVFKKLTGVSPSHYKKQQLSDKRI